MLYWENQIMTFVINSLLLVGFALFYTWLDGQRTVNGHRLKFHRWYLIALTVSSLLLLHVASVLQMMEAHNPNGYGWTYISFQVGIIMYTLFSSRDRLMWVSLSAVLLVWFLWLPGVSNRPLFWVISVGLCWVAQHYNRLITAKRWWYYPFGLLFALPFYWGNLMSVDGIDVGWFWMLLSTLTIDAVLWQIHSMLVRHHLRRAELLREANIDNLTKLNNFRVFNEDLLQAYDHFQRTGEHFSLFTFDVDHFKQINDQYGHVTGNTVLVKVADRFDKIVREMNYRSKTYRTGGEEFCFILFDIDETPASSLAIAEQLRTELSQLIVTTPQGDDIQITVSLGQDLVDVEDQNYMDTYKRADKRLYQSKQTGRNRVTVREIPMTTVGR